MEDKFTAREVAVLVESFRNDISVIAEGVRGLGDRVEGVENRLEGIEGRFILVEDAIRVSLPDIFKRLSRAGI